jgi:hypothetical protein
MQTYFWNETLRVSDSSSGHHQEFFTVHTPMVYVIQVCWQLTSKIRMELEFFTVHTAMVYVIQVCWKLACKIRVELVPSWSCSQAVSKPVWHIPLLCVQWKTPDDWQRNCPNHVVFHSKNTFEKLVHLVGFIIRNNLGILDIYLVGYILEYTYNARTHKR